MSSYLIYPQQLQFKVVVTVELSFSLPTLKSFLKGSTHLSCLIILLLIPEQQHVACLATSTRTVWFWKNDWLQRALFLWCDDVWSHWIFSTVCWSYYCFFTKESLSHCMFILPSPARGTLCPNLVFRLVYVVLTELMGVVLVVLVCGQYSTSWFIGLCLHCTCIRPNKTFSPWWMPLVMIQTVVLMVLSYRLILQSACV